MPKFRIGRLGPNLSPRESQFNCLLSVQLRWPNLRPARLDRQTAGAGDRLQSHGPRQGVDEGQEEGTFSTLLTSFFSV